MTEERDLDLGRRVNERIADTAEELGFEGDVPFVCECRGGRCPEFVLLPVEAYRALRATTGRLVVRPGHEDRHVDRVVEVGSRFVVVER